MQNASDINSDTETKSEQLHTILDSSRSSLDKKEYKVISYDDVDTENEIDPDSDDGPPAATLQNQFSQFLIRQHTLKRTVEHTTLQRRATVFTQRSTHSTHSTNSTNSTNSTKKTPDRPLRRWTIIGNVQGVLGKQDPGQKALVFGMNFLKGAMKFRSGIKAPIRVDNVEDKDIDHSLSTLDMSRSTLDASTFIVQRFDDVTDEDKQATKDSNHLQQIQTVQDTNFQDFKKESSLDSPESNSPPPKSRPPPRPPSRPRPSSPVPSSPLRKQSSPEPPQSPPTSSTGATTPPATEKGEAQKQKQGSIKRPWINDDERTHCQMCQREFSWISRRKHHCRACGEIFCHDCAPPNDHDVRVCRPCLKTKPAITRTLPQPTSSFPALPPR